MITLTETAKEEIVRLLKDKNDPSYFLRVGVKGGGCSGMTYTVDLDNQSDEFDKVHEEGPVKVLCDQKSFVYLNGLEIDFRRE